jgi:hypothetical protein
MHYLSLNYFVNQPPHVSDIFTAPHQEVFSVYVRQLVRVIRLGDWLLAGSGMNSRPGQQPVDRTYNTYQLPYIYSEYLLMMGSKHARNI